MEDKEQAKHMLFAEWCNKQYAQQAPVLTKKLKKTKFDIYSFRDPKSLRVSLSGAYHKDGTVTVSDGRILLVTKDGYNTEFDGRIVLSNGEFVAEGVKYPTISHILEGLKSANYVNIDVPELLQFLQAIKPQVTEHKKKEGNGSLQIVAVKVSGLWKLFYYQDLVTVATGANHIGANKIGVINNDRAPAVLGDVDSNECCIIQPTTPDYLEDKTCTYFFYDVDGSADGKKSKFTYRVEKWVKVKTEQVVDIWAESEEEALALLKAGEGQSTPQELDKRTIKQLTIEQNDGQPTVIVTRER